MPTKFKGSTLVEQPQVATWKIGTGGNTRRTFIGSPTEIVAQALFLQNLGYETEITTGPKYTLTATINVDLVTNPNTSTEPEPTPTWELIPHPMEQSIYECGRPFVAALPSTVKASIETKLKNPQNKSLFVVPIEYSSAQLIDDAFRIYTMKSLGLDSRRIYTVSLKRSIIVSSRYTCNWSLDNVNAVLTTNKLINDYNVPMVMRGLLPPAYSAPEVIPIEDKTVANRNVVIPFFYGWLEQHPSYQFVSSNKIQISQEWVFNKWVVGSETGYYDLAG